MTNIYEEYEEFITKHKFIKKICDWCGEEIPEPDMWNTREFELIFTEGSSYPEGGSANGWQVNDLCNICIDKLKAFFEANNVHIDDVNINW